jgi:hypothetical protein
MFAPKKLIFELNNHFLAHELMNSFGASYLWFWLNLDVEGFFRHLNEIKFVNYVPKKHEPTGSGLWIPLMLDPTTFDKQHSLFVLRKMSNCHG